MNTVNQHVSKGLTTRDITYIGIFAALMGVCSWISIPAPVPFTLQTMGVFLALWLLGGKKGTMAIACYILMGAIGLPMFAGMTGGMSVILGTTGGYIVGFLASAMLYWAITNTFGNSTKVKIAAMLIGLVA